MTLISPTEADDLDRAWTLMASFAPTNKKNCRALTAQVAEMRLNHMAEANFCATSFGAHMAT